MKLEPTGSSQALEVRRAAKVPRRLDTGSRWGAQDRLGELLGAFESETATVILRTSPGIERMTLYLLLVFIVLALILAGVVKLDRVVTGQGRMVPVNGEIYISAFDTGIVRQVLVKAGDIVKKGQPLAKLDPTFTQADVTQLQQKRASDEAQIARCQAELNGQPYVYSPGNSYRALQGGLYDKRQAQYRADIANYDSQIRSSEALMAQYTSDVNEYTKRLKIAQDVEANYRSLVAKGYISELQLTQAIDARTEMERLLGDARNLVESNRETAASLRAQRDSYVEKRHSETTTELVTARNDLDSTRELLAKALKMRELASLDSPADAIVIKVGKVSAGSIAAGGGQATVTPTNDPLFTLMPLEGELLAQINVPAEDVGFVRIGDPVTVKLDAYNYILHGTASGRVKTVSENSFTLDDNNQPAPPFFRVAAVISAMNLRNVPNDARIVPGMTLTGDIVVGHRTILSYLTEGALRTGSEAMREP